MFGFSSKPFTLSAEAELGLDNGRRKAAEQHPVVVPTPTRLVLAGGRRHPRFVRIAGDAA